MMEKANNGKKTNGRYMKVITVHLPPVYIEVIDMLVEEGRYPNRAEAVRMAVRDFIRSEASTVIDRVIGKRGH